jgi:glycogen(starch) synthase
MPTAEPKVLLVGDFPPPYGGVAVHVDVVRGAVRASGGLCTVLDIGKGQLPAEGVVPAGGYARFAASLFGHAVRGYRIHVHTSGANPKSWALAATCAAAGRLAGVAPLITFHSGLGPGWLAEDPLRARIACTVASAFVTVIAVSEPIRDALLTCGVPSQRIEVLPAFSSSFLDPGEPPWAFRELRRDAAPLYCAMLARGPVYGAEFLLRAFAEVYSRNPRARLALYGPATTELDLSHAGSAASAVRTFGELRRPAALAVIAGSDVYVRPTLADGDSVSVREAVALGCRVVATSVGTRPEAVALVPPGDAKALASALLQAGEAGPVLRVARDAAAQPGGDCVRRLLELYGFPAVREAAKTPRHLRSRASVEEPACAASAAF